MFGSSRSRKGRKGAKHEGWGDVSRQKCEQKCKNARKSDKNPTKTAKIIPKITIKRKMNEKSSHEFQGWISATEPIEKQKMRKPARLYKVSRIIKHLSLLMISRFLKTQMQNFASFCKVPVSI